MSNEEISTLGMIGILIAILGVFIIAILYLLSLDKLVKIIKTDNNSVTFISRVWVWTQLIPIWSVIAIIVYHVKMISAVRALELNLSLQKDDIKYPVIIGWFLALAFLYSWIPIIGALVGVIMWITYWIKIVSTSKQIFNLKSTRIEIN